MPNIKKYPLCNLGDLPPHVDVSDILTKPSARLTSFYASLFSFQSKVPEERVKYEEGGRKGRTSKRGRLADHLPGSK